jgi:hypothetical protein
MFDLFIGTKLFASWPALLPGAVLVGLFWLQTSYNPASLRPTDVRNTSDQFAALLDRLQMHSQCRPNYCLRVRKGNVTPQFSAARFEGVQNLRESDTRYHVVSFAYAKVLNILSWFSGT